MDRDDEFTQPPRPPGEGIRIIGAEEAAAALEAGQAEGRKPSDAPRFGDVPPAPSGPRPAIRFPLDADESAGLSNPVGVGGTRVEPVGETPESPGEPTVASPELPHWTEPATGEVPLILGGSESEDEEDDRSWSSFTRAPRWRDQGDDWDDDAFGDASVLADEGSRLGALDTSRTEHSDLFSFDDADLEPPAPPPTRIRTRSDPIDYAEPDSGRSGRDNGVAIIIGGALGLLFLLLAKAGPKYLMVYAGLVVVLCATEVFAVLRRAGYKPATLLGLVATVSVLAAGWWKGEAALPLVVVLTLVFSMLWYLAGVIQGRPMVNVAVTVFGFCWTGLFGAYAALLLRPGSHIGHPRDGVALLLGAVLCTVANDVGAYGVGRTFGRTPLAPEISPHKTLEGLLGGTVFTILVGAGLVSHIHPFSTSKGFWLAVGIAIVAPVGDLCESLIKRDIGLKDMGSLLPGHGGMMDRFDALLFVLPTTYYLAQVLKIGR
jgi:phosphatidate cytidylyltransferase